MVSINVPVKGVEELVIEVHDGGNRNTSDHAVIANPKLTTNNTKPNIDVKDKTYLLGENVDIMEGITAEDTEDGDLTSKIEVVSNTYEDGKTGRFEVLYRVTDSDDNVTERKAFITIYENFTVNKTKYGSFDNLSEYNKEFKLPIVSAKNNAGNYGSSVIGYAIDENINTHWETNSPNSSSFENEVIFDLGENVDIDKMTYASRRGGKGFARNFEIYVSSKSEGDDFILAGKGAYDGSVNDVIEFKLSKFDVRRVKFKFINAHQNWASIGEVAFYKEDVLPDKINNDLFIDANKTEVNEEYNTLEKLEVLREDIKNHPAFSLFEDDLNKAKEIIIAKFPTLNVEENTFVKLNSEFDLMSNVVANDQEDGNITSNVKINTNEFTTSKAGEYALTYTVTDSDGNSTSKERKVVVYSENKYLSDMDWEVATSGWRSVNKDSAVASTNKIKLNIDGTINEFDKGIGAATNAEIVYNLDGNYSYFTTYLGTDKNYNDNRTSIIFRIFADGEEIYTSDVIRKDSKAEFVSLDITGVKELKLVADDAGDGGLGDFTSWADTKVYTTNSKPQLTIPKSISTKLGEVVDLNESYSAIDTEDGDITSNIEVRGKVNFNKPGKYPIIYTVTDSDGNKVSKTRTIAVVNMDDNKYLTDYEWNSTQNSYKSPNKDKSISGNTIKLTDENNQEVVYERGIGAHSTSTIIYDLSDKDYAYFTSYVGVDRAMFGTVGCVSFEVYVDGEKKFDSGVMNSREPQKYVEVDINDAKELKLVVTDGGNGQGSDHASWADAKLHFANAESSVDLSEVVSIEDKYLKSSIKKVLNLSSDNITVGDMQKITSLNVQGAESLNGLQYAKNLESLNIEYNEISDLSPIKDLKKLTDLRANPQIITLGSIDKKDNRVTIDYDVLNRKGEKLSPISLTIRNNQTLEDITLDLSQCVDENGVISFDTTYFDSVIYSVYLGYEDINDNYLSQVLFMFSNK
ncbi:NPCBM/NEW2 domain [uncultured Clostridium sp.]|nr:NPCBM/NEW2 domain [uncultured Clostridium sp.]